MRVNGDVTPVGNQDREWTPRPFGCNIAKSHAVPCFQLGIQANNRRAMIHKKCSPGRIRIYLLFAVALAFSIPASAEWKEKVLYSFQGGTNDGSLPVGGVVFDKQGNIYGALEFYGPGRAPPGKSCGAVYQLSPPAQKGGAWEETLIYEFGGKGANDGEVTAGGSDRRSRQSIRRNRLWRHGKLHAVGSGCGLWNGL